MLKTLIKVINTRKEIKKIDIKIEGVLELIEKYKNKEQDRFNIMTRVQLENDLINLRCKKYLLKSR